MKTIRIGLIIALSLCMIVGIVMFHNERKRLEGTWVMTHYMDAIGEAHTREDFENAGMYVPVLTCDGETATVNMNNKHNIENIEILGNGNEYVMAVPVSGAEGSLIIDDEGMSLDINLYGCNMTMEKVDRD